MRYFNGRVLMNGAQRASGLLCATSKAEAVRLGKQAFGDYFSIRELNNYWAECWGTAAQLKLGEQSEPGAFIEIDNRFFRLVDRL